MHRATKRMMAAIGLAASLGACSDMTAYERAVEDWEPVYCYQSIGDGICYTRPFERDASRLINFYGPPPRTYRLPPPPPPIYLDPPPKERAKDRPREARAAHLNDETAAFKPAAGPRRLGPETASNQHDSPL